MACPYYRKGGYNDRQIIGGSKFNTIKQDRQLTPNAAYRLNSHTLSTYCYVHAGLIEIIQCKDNISFLVQTIQFECKCNPVSITLSALRHVGSALVTVSCSWLQESNSRPTDHNTDVPPCHKITSHRLCYSEGKQNIRKLLEKYIWY